MRAPIFIIGYPRSGTSFVGKLVAQFTGYRSHGESHTLTLLQELHHQINLYRRRTDFTGKELVKQLDLQKLKQLNTKYFREFYLNTYGSERFIDKTPGAVACHGWGVVKDAFPSAVFIACVRSPVEIIESAKLKFVKNDEEDQSTDDLEISKGWVGAMSGIENLKNSSHSKDLHIVSQLCLRANPRKVVSDLFSFLGIPGSDLEKALELCTSSREDVLTKSIGRDVYKRLNELDLDGKKTDELQSILSATCDRWGIEL